MISYAQNFEDVILNRVFRNRRSGFYIDVGAMDPVLHSVTKCFYDQGWCGINIEPNEWFFNKLTAERPRDINLNLALGERDELKTFHVFEEYGISTFDEKSRDRCIELGFKSEQKTVQVTTLAAICQDHVDRPIDFLKVDCEGWEKLALAGADWERFRPTVVVVEATLPLTTIPSHLEWESILIGAQYDMAYFDGLNRFYLRHDSPGLRTHFSVPPNVFDEFKVHATEMAERERDGFAGRIVELEQKLLSTTASLDAAEATGRELKAERDRLSIRPAELEAQIARYASQVMELENERRELGQVLLKTRLWVGQLSQDLAGRNRLTR
jgi:FkbM family methyltransferase